MPIKWWNPFDDIPCVCCGKTAVCGCTVGHDTMCVVCRKCDKCCICIGGPEHDPRRKPKGDEKGEQ